MSRGPGRIERAIEAAFTDGPDDAYTTEDLIDRAYSGVNRAEKKHRVAVIRAAKKVSDRMDWECFRTEALGGTLVFWNPYDVMSYAIGRIKADMFVSYRSNDRRVLDHHRRTADDIRAMLAPGGKYHPHVVEGGAWWRHVQLNIARRDGDMSETAQALQAEQDKVSRQVRAMGAAMRGAFGR